MGYDCSADTALHYSLQYEKQSPLRDWRENSDEPDPFLLKFLAECSKNAYGMSPQIEAL